MKYTKQEVNEALEYLHKYLKPSDKVYTILRQVSRSGMSRHISVLRGTRTGDIAEAHEPHDITYLVARVLGERRDDKDGGLVVSGCGMDMGFEIVYRLGYALFPNGFEVKGIGRNGDASGWDKDGGYALKQEWL
jgi:hypothetical protein